MGLSVKDKIDILLPTTGERYDGLIYQIEAVLNQSYRSVHLWVLVDGEAVVKRFLDSRVSIVKVPKEFSGNHGHTPIKWALETLPLDGEWVWMTGDDDCLLPWGIEGLVKEGAGADMITGVCLAVSRGKQWVAERTPLGLEMQLGRVTGSSCLYRRSRLNEVGYDDVGYTADWTLIKKMLKFPCKHTNHVIAVMPQYG